MADRVALRDILHRIDGRSYPAYRELERSFALGEVRLCFDHVQGDPFAAPSRARVWMPGVVSAARCASRDEREAAEDWLLRRLAGALAGSRRGSGRSGELSVLRPGPEVVERSALRLDRDGGAEIRLRVGLPARGRRVLGQQAWELLSKDLLGALRVVHEGPGLAEHVRSVCEQRLLRRGLAAAGLVAFVADGSVLPRASGVTQEPLAAAVPVRAPASLRCELPGLDGPVVGLGIPEGVTVIVGGGFHGKSTLLDAIARGHLDHIPGDGRERVVAVSSSAKVRAEDGRSVCGVDIRPFLRELPGGHSTRRFSTRDASGSTSQAAAIVEAVEAGATALWMDEDTSATNLLVHDERMWALVPREREPITPLVERVGQLHRDWGISTVLVVGGVADYLAAADCVIALDHWEVNDVTARARGLFSERPQPPDLLPPRTPRIPLPGASEGSRVRARDERRVQVGEEELELSAVASLRDADHARSVGEALRWIHGALVDGRRTLPQVLDALDAILDDEGVELLSPRAYPDGELVRPTRLEVAAALSRQRSLRIAY